MKFEFSKALMSENPLRCTTYDEKGLLLITIFFYFIFESP
jgi:hypothetical protein